MFTKLLAAVGAVALSAVVVSCIVSLCTGSAGDSIVAMQILCAIFGVR